jgi:hypothetical protein
MISCFYLTLSGGNTELYLMTDYTAKLPNILLTLNSNTVPILISSFYGYQSNFSKLCFTVILVDITSFNSHQFAYYPQVEPITQNNTNLGIPTDFNPYQSQKCILGIIWF